MSGEQLRPLENRPYLDQWRKRLEDAPIKKAKLKKHKKGKKGKNQRAKP